MTELRIGPVRDWGALGLRWRDLEQRADASFFQSWTWTGCRVEERFPDAVLVEAIDGARTVALALFNRRRGRFGSILHLSESGDAALDCPYIEQNGVLAEAGRETELTALCLRAAARLGRLVLSGVGPAEITACARGGLARHVTRVRKSPAIDLAAIRHNGGDLLAHCSANTRQQIRRSNRLYAAAGPITAASAEGLDQALSWLEEMAALHQATWQSRGQPGSFAHPYFGRFHRTLIARGLPRGEVMLWRIASGEATIGILYNFLYRRRMLSYQSGLRYPEDDNQRKPGLTCHHAAIQQAVTAGCDVYDFLAGDARYKTSLANQSYEQVWLQAGLKWHVALWPAQILSRWRGQATPIDPLARSWRCKSSAYSA